MSRNHAIVVSFALVLISIGAAAYYYAKVPPEMPTHWDLAGHVNGYMPRFWGLAIWPIVIASMAALLVVLPMVSPKNFSLERSIGTYNLLVVAIEVFLFATSLIALEAATGAQLPVQSLVPGLIGILFIVLGNYMGKLQKNFFIGIRTPWTLASDEVWSRTHRLGGWVFILGGLAMLVEAVTGANPSALLIVAALVAIIPVGYSFIVSKRIEGFGPDSSLNSENNS